MNGAIDTQPPQDIIQRLRMMLMGQNPEAPSMAATGAGSPEKGTSYSVSHTNMPMEAQGYQQALQALNNRLVYSDPASRVNGFLGMTALDGSGPYGFTSYEPQIGVGYGPLSVMGGYRTMTPSEPRAKSRNSYEYGGSLTIPLDEAARETPGQGLSAILSGQGSTNRGQTQLMGGLQAPLLGGLLSVDVAADPRLRRKEIIAGYRRQF